MGTTVTLSSTRTRAASAGKSAAAAATKGQHARSLASCADAPYREGDAGSVRGGSYCVLQRGPAFATGASAPIVVDACSTTDCVKEVPTGYGASLMCAVTHPLIMFEGSDDRLGLVLAGEVQVGLSDYGKGD